MNTKSRCRALVVLPLLAAVACDDDDGRSATATSTTVTAPSTPATTAPTPSAPTTIAVAPPTSAAMPSPGSTSSVPSTSASPDPVVDVRLLAFRPDRISAAVGQTIRWTQSDAGFHTITSGTVDQSGGIVTASPDGRFDSGQLATDETFELTLTEPGSYEYFCSIHPATMHGVVEVT